jgi:hypothetical protein
MSPAPARQRCPLWVSGRGPGEGARSAGKSVAPDAVPEVFARAVDQNAEVVARDSQDLAVLVILVLLLKANARCYALLLGQLVVAAERDITALQWPAHSSGSSPLLRLHVGQPERAASPAVPRSAR